MIHNYEITGTIVLFNNDISVLKRTVDSFLKTTLIKRLFLVDNSPTNSLEKYFLHKDIEYIFMGKNFGFGKAHNIVLEKLSSKYHLILNPDIVFSTDIIQILIEQLDKNPDVAFITPKVLYPNNEIQYVCRKHPTLFDLINRRFKLSQKAISQNEYRDRNLTKPFFPDFIHGCFMFFKTNDFIELGGFNERYFLYMEDADICREIDKLGKKKLFFPSLEITHLYQKGSSNNIKLFSYHISSAIKYFLKWGL
tara:strand:- start:3201 stop:3953 length:753 start_codon:yes stop_codon:yes gene_type:complete